MSAGVSGCRNRADQHHADGWVLLFSIFAGRLADRASDWKQAILLGTGLSTAFSLFLGFAEGFWMILLGLDDDQSAGRPRQFRSRTPRPCGCRCRPRAFPFGAGPAPGGNAGLPLAMCFLTGYVILWLGAPILSSG